MSETFELRFPPQPEFLSAARVFAASVGRGAGCTGEVLDDLRLGVSEACTEAILGAGHEGSVDLSLITDDDRLRIRVRAPGSDAPKREDGVDLLPALFDDADTATSDGHRSVSFSIPLP